MSNLRDAQRGDASDLVGTVIVKDADGNVIPMIDEDGYELLGVATGELYVDPDVSPLPLSPESNHAETV